MDRVAHEERERLRAKYVAELVELGYEEPDAQFAVRLYFGESRGDIVSDPPLTKQLYRAMGLDLDFLFEVPPELAALARYPSPRPRRS
jgi:hypothetical protein